MLGAVGTMVANRSQFTFQEVCTLAAQWDQWRSFYSFLPLPEGHIELAQDGALPSALLEHASGEPPLQLGLGPLAQRAELDAKGWR